MNHKKRWLIIGGIALFLVVVVLFADLGAVVDLLLQTNWLVWLVGVAFLLVGYVFNTGRWRYLLSSNPGWLSLFYGDSIAYMSNMVTPIPTAISRILTTAWVTSAAETEATSDMVIDRLLETTMRLLATIFLISLLATGQADATSSVLINVGIVVLGVGGLVWMIRHQALVVDKLSRWISHLPHLNEDQLRNTIGALLENLAYAGSTRHLLVGLAISIIMWSLFLVFQYLALTALRPPQTHIDRQILLPALGVLILIPPSSTAMIGLYHAIVIGALAGFRLLDITTAAAYAILLHMPQMVFWLLAGTLALGRTDIQYKKLLEAARAYRHKDQESLEAGDV